jgi:hypothetical protein
MFAGSVLCKIAVKATQITGLAAAREYLRFFLIRWDGKSEKRFISPRGEMINQQYR